MPKQKERKPLPKFKFQEIAGVIKINDHVEGHRFFNNLARQLHFPTSNPLSEENYMPIDERSKTKRVNENNSLGYRFPKYNPSD